MAKAKKKAAHRPAAKGPALPGPSLPPRILEEAAQGWLQSAGNAPTTPRPAPADTDHRLVEALGETLRELREAIGELRSRLDRLEDR